MVMSIRSQKLSSAQKMAELAGLPEPLAFIEWPVPEEKHVMEVKLATGVNIPFNDVLEFLKQYKTHGTNSF